MQRTRKHRRLWRSLAVTGVAVLALTAAVLPSRAGALDPDEAEPDAPQAADAATAPPALTLGPAVPATDLQQRWNDYLNSGDGLTGADSTYSVPLPDGRRVFLFSDSFLFHVNPDGSRPLCEPLVNQTMVVQDGGELTTIHGGTREEPESLVGPTPVPPEECDPQEPAPDHWYWSGDGIVDGNKLRVFYLRFVRTPEGGQFGFRWDTTAIGTWSLPDLTFEGLTPAHDAGGVTWGSALTSVGGHTYVYGVEDLGAEKYMHIARVPRGKLTDPRMWRFWTGSDWSPDPAASARVLDHVANEYSVTRIGRKYVLVTHDTSVPFGGDVVAYQADRPTGPFEQRTLLYQTPETGTRGGNVWTYNAHAHPGLSGDPNRLIVSYNVNSLVYQDVIDDVTIYRPRFLEVPVSGG